MRRLVASLRFFTILPLPGWLPGAPQDLDGSLPLVPLVGLMLGVAVACADNALGRIFPISVTSVLTVVMLLGVTGGLHMDGLADTADGFFSARPRERILEIMRDSRSGAMGIMGVVAVFCLKCTALAAVHGAMRWATIAAMPMAGRCSMLVLSTLLPDVRDGSGMNALFGPPPRPWHLALAVTLLLAFAGGTSGLHGLARAAASLTAAVLFAAFCRSKIGGHTGDTLGASSELTELAFCLAAAARW